MKKATELLKQQQVIFIGYIWPEPNSSAAGYRTLALIQAFLDQGALVSFACAAEKNEHSTDLSALGVSSLQISLNDSSFELLIKNLNPTIVIYDRFISEEQYGWRVEKVCPHALKILDTCDLHFLRRARERALNKQDATNEYLNEKLDFNHEDTWREVGAIYRCDLSLIISSYEYQLLIEHFNINADLLLLLPFMLQRDQQAISPSFTQRKNFIMLGNFLHQPNWDALLWCHKHIWPKIRQQLSDAQLHVYGAYTTDKVRQLQQLKHGLIIKGRADNLVELLKEYRVNLAPLRFGAGIKGKIADGFLQGLPCVTTHIGAEGMADNLAWGGYIADNNEEFSQAAINLYTDETKWLKAQQQGFRCIDEQHHKANGEQRLIDKIIAIQKQLNSQRKNNFIGNMLKYHLYQRTKYLSRWIEEKNKNNG